MQLTILTVHPYKYLHMYIYTIRSFEPIPCNKNFVKEFYNEYPFMIKQLLSNNLVLYFHV